MDDSINLLLCGREVYTGNCLGPLSRVGEWPVDEAHHGGKPLFIRSDSSPDIFVQVQSLIEMPPDPQSLAEVLGPPKSSPRPHLMFMGRPIFADVIMRECLCGVCKSKLVQGPGLYPKMHVTLEDAFGIAQKMMDPASGLEFVLTCARAGCMFHTCTPTPPGSYEIIDRILQLRMLMKDMANAFQETMTYYSSTLKRDLLMCRVVERDGPAMDAVKFVDRTSSMLYHLWTAGPMNWECMSRLRANVFMPFLHHKVPGKFNFHISMKKDSEGDTNVACPVCEGIKVVCPSPPSACFSCVSCRLFFCSRCDRYGAEPLVCCDVGVSRVAALMKRAEAEGIVCIEIED